MIGIIPGKTTVHDVENRMNPLSLSFFIFVVVVAHCYDLFPVSSFELMMII